MAEGGVRKVAGGTPKAALTELGYGEAGCPQALKKRAQPSGPAPLGVSQRLSGRLTWDVVMKILYAPDISVVSERVWVWIYPLYSACGWAKPEPACGSVVIPG